MSIFKSAKTYYALLLQVTMSLSNYAKDHQSFDLSDGVVLDKANNTVFVSHPTNGIDGVSLDSGKVIWHSDEADKPLMLHDSELVSQAQSPIIGELLLVSLDKNSGVMLAGNSFILPERVVATVSQGLRHNFKIKLNNASNSLDWSHSYKKAQGMPSMPMNNTTNKKSVNSKTYGNIVFDFSNLSNGVSLLKEAQLTINSEKSKGFTLPTEGLFIDQKDGRQFTSVSKHAILVSQLNDVASLTDKYRWGIYSLDNQLLGTFKHGYSYRPFEVVGDTVLMTTLPQTSYADSKNSHSPMLLKAYSLSAGKIKWEHEVKDHRYTGPYPQ